MLNDLADKSYLSLPGKRAVLKTHEERVREALQRLRTTATITRPRKTEGVTMKPQNKIIGLDIASKAHLKKPMYPFKLRRLAIRVHRNRANAVKWLAAVTYLGKKWIITKQRKAA